MDSGAAVDYGLPEVDFAEVLAKTPDLESLGTIAGGCARCRLREGCRGVVFGEGNRHAHLVLIGEAPGATEDELGRPFVGKAGELLDRILEAAGLDRGEVYISNVVLCRPPGNRPPQPDEMALCRPYLRRRLELIRPEIVVALGATATAALLRPGARITQERGRFHRVGGWWVMPTFHPAALLRDPSKKKAVWEDFQMVSALVRRLEAAGPSG